MAGDQPGVVVAADAALPLLDLHDVDGMGSHNDEVIVVGHAPLDGDLDVGNERVGVGECVAQEIDDQALAIIDRRRADREEFGHRAIVIDARPINRHNAKTDKA